MKFPATICAYLTHGRMDRRKVGRKIRRTGGRKEGKTEGRTQRRRTRLNGRTEGMKEGTHKQRERMTVETKEGQTTELGGID